MMLFGNFVDSLFWGFALLAFLFAVDLFSDRNFGDAVFSLPGFIMLAFYAFLIIWVVRFNSKPNNSNSAAAKK